MAVETKQLRNINFLKLLIEVESLIQAGYGINYRGTAYNGVEFRVNMVRNSDVVSEVSKEVESKEVVSKEEAGATDVTTSELNATDTTTETKVSSELSKDKVETPKNTTTKKTAKTKAPVDNKSPVNTTVEVKKDGE